MYQTFPFLFEVGETEQATEHTSVLGVSYNGEKWGGGEREEGGGLVLHFLPDQEVIIYYAHSHDMRD